ncbi:hypothetical protein B9Z55_019343 [Caenorhabditis nigoni]|uniref:Uncharacterized protein n=1 Tax=Caenorhabditis nigoni TaxID=1611254 RepID=A0A2G5TI46_9PELO|nr:hypothetical protein B9Z55_019343 [Caenorhabditis nigoni]
MPPPHNSQDFDDFENGFQGRLQDCQTKGKVRKWELVKFQNFQVEGDTCTPGATSRISRTVCWDDIGTILIRTIYAAEQKERNLIDSGMHHIPGEDIIRIGIIHIKTTEIAGPTER